MSWPSVCALTSTPIDTSGGVLCCIRLCGARGFSKERSFTYCALTMSCCCAASPLPGADPAPAMVSAIPCSSRSEALASTDRRRGTTTPGRFLPGEVWRGRLPFQRGRPIYEERTRSRTWGNDGRRLPISRHYRLCRDRRLSGVSPSQRLGPADGCGAAARCLRRRRARERECRLLAAAQPSPAATGRGGGGTGAIGTGGGQGRRPQL